MKAKLDHVGIAVRRMNQAALLFGHFGLEQPRVVRIGNLNIGFLHAGGAQLELLEPVGPDTVVARFLEHRGEGLHHLCFDVGDLRAALTELRGLGIEPVGPAPQKGVEGDVAFLHPKVCGGVLVELLEKSR